MNDFGDAPYYFGKQINNLGVRTCDFVIVRHDFGFPLDVFGASSNEIAGRRIEIELERASSTAAVVNSPVAIWLFHGEGVG